MRRIATVSALVIGILTTASITQAAAPALSAIRPTGAQRGTEVEVAFSGGRLEDAEEILIYSPGFEVTHFEVKGNRILTKLKIGVCFWLLSRSFLLRKPVCVYYGGTLRKGSKTEKANKSVQCFASRGTKRRIRRLLSLGSGACYISIASHSRSKRESLYQIM